MKVSLCMVASCIFLQWISVAFHCAFQNLLICQCVDWITFQTLPILPFLSLFRLFLSDSAFFSPVRSSVFFSTSSLFLSPTSLSFSSLLFISFLLVLIFVRQFCLPQYLLYACLQHFAIFCMLKANAADTNKLVNKLARTRLVHQLRSDNFQQKNEVQNSPDCPRAQFIVFAIGIGVPKDGRTSSGTMR